MSDQISTDPAPAAPPQAAPGEAPVLSIANIQNAVRVIDYCADQGALKGWATIELVLGVRNRFNNFLKLVAPSIDPASSPSTSSPPASSGAPPAAGASDIPSTDRGAAFADATTAAEPPTGAAAEAAVLNVTDIQNMVRVIDYCADQGVLKGWGTIEQVLEVRNSLDDFIKAVVPQSADPAADPVSDAPIGSGPSGEPPSRMAMADAVAA